MLASDEGLWVVVRCCIETKLDCTAVVGRPQWVDPSPCAEAQKQKSVGLIWPNTPRAHARG